MEGLTVAAHPVHISFKGTRRCSVATFDGDDALITKDQGTPRARAGAGRETHG
jgi:hypothetical protein